MGARPRISSEHTGAGGTVPRASHQVASGQGLSHRGSAIVPRPTSWFGTRPRPASRVVSHPLVVAVSVHPHPGGRRVPCPLVTPCSSTILGADQRARERAVGSRSLARDHRGRRGRHGRGVHRTALPAPGASSCDHAVALPHALDVGAKRGSDQASGFPVLGSRRTHWVGASSAAGGGGGGGGGSSEETFAPTSGASARVGPDSSTPGSSNRVVPVHWSGGNAFC